MPTLSDVMCASMWLLTPPKLLPVSGLLASAFHSLPLYLTGPAAHPGRRRGGAAAAGGGGGRGGGPRGPGGGRAAARPALPAGRAAARRAPPRQRRCTLRPRAGGAHLPGAAVPRAALPAQQQVGGGRGSKGRLLVAAAVGRVACMRAERLTVADTPARPLLRFSPVVRPNAISSDHNCRSRSLVHLPLVLHAGFAAHGNHISPFS